MCVSEYRDSELKIVGEYGLRNKREVWRVQLTLSKIRRAARYVKNLPPHTPLATMRHFVLQKMQKMNKKDEEVD